MRARSWLTSKRVESLATILASSKLSIASRVALIASPCSDSASLRAFSTFKDSLSNDAEILSCCCALDLPRCFNDVSDSILFLRSSSDCGFTNISAFRTASPMQSISSHAKEGRLIMSAVLVISSSFLEASCWTDATYFSLLFSKSSSAGLISVPRNSTPLPAYTPSPSPTKGSSVSPFSSSFTFSLCAPASSTRPASIFARISCTVSSAGAS
mmetsp:Transcript_20919/g.39123  ORF Transcript_20919/g.39123 Transcript_20919/m.39123 type:complete len:213 (-) Transcript_20919:383-1021(-)